MASVSSGCVSGTQKDVPVAPILGHCPPEPASSALPFALGGADSELGFLLTEEGARQPEMGATSSQVLSTYFIPPDL